MQNVSFFYSRRTRLLNRRRGEWILQNVSLDLREGECIGIVGESGSGKSTLAHVIGRQYRAQSGEIFYGGKQNFSRKEFCRYVQNIWQFPGDALDPLWSIGKTLREPLKIHFPDLSRLAVEEKIKELLHGVSLDDSLLQRRPSALSGGQKQRVALARALAVGPCVLICDEVTSALDMPVQWEILNLLNILRAKQRLAILFISHDIAAVAQVADRVIVMQKGKIIESGPTAEICRHPHHRYTETLINEVLAMRI
ncbi:MAG: ATP-binding cassette domain-containing protein [Puniceicoccales bacterium]|nr:ATP-binding cassette domain-containing protein [Puniceicoccales bacterium]